MRFIRAAVAAQFHKNGSFEPLLWNLAIVSMRISTGAPQRSRGRCKVFGQFRPKTLHLNKAGNLESQGFQGFRLCSVRIKIRYFNGNRRALRVSASHKNPTRRWRYQNKTIALFFMDSSMEPAQWLQKSAVSPQNLLIPPPGARNRKGAEASLLSVAVPGRR